MFDSDEDFERMTRNLKIDREPPPGHRQELRRQMLAAFAEAQADQGDSSPAGRWRVRLKGIATMRNWKIRVAAAVLVAGLIGAGVYCLTGTQSVAFADVVRAILDTSTVTYKVTAAGKINGKEVPKQEFDAAYMAPDRERLASKESIMVFDSAKGKYLTLLPKSKLAMIMTATNKPKDIQSKNTFEELRKRLERIQSGQKENVVSLGKKTIGGRAAVGYRLTEGVWPLTIWADAETKLPLVMDIELKLSDGGDVTTSMTDFAWGVQLNKDLFSLEVPNGYTLQESKIDMSNPTEKDLIEMLRTWSSYMDGALPPKVDMSAYFDFMKPLGKAMGESMAKKMVKSGKVKAPEPTSQEVAAIQEPIVKVMRGIKFVMNLAPACDWQYVGKGVKLNAADTSIAWYRPEKSETYRVIYADLTVKDMPLDQLPKKPQEQTR